MSQPRAKGRRGELEVARIVGGKRTPLSGADGGNDISFVAPAVMDAWGIEVKRRKRLWTELLSWLAQAEYALPIGSMRKPAVAAREDRGRWLFVAYLEDVVTWAEALADDGKATRRKAIAHQLRALAAEVESV